MQFLKPDPLLLIYLGSPYSNPKLEIREGRYNAALAATTGLLRAGYMVYSPIVHNHHIAQRGDLPTGWQHWKKHDTLILLRCDILSILTLPGWNESPGLTDEIGICRKEGKPVHKVAREGHRYGLELKPLW